MENSDKEVKNSKDTKFKPIKDSLAIVVSVLIIGVIFMLTTFLKPTSNNLYVEIKYDNVVLYDPYDMNKETHISFPSSGERKIEFRKEDGNLYDGINKDFDFKGEFICVTLYSNKSVQILSSDVTCPDHTCSKMGRISYTFTPIVCLPNKFQVTIISSSLPEFDA